jgi:aspartyl-tRNA(Asn)/glutamyl-tRNA(Gln) amidotransferase subunit A
MNKSRRDFTKAAAILAVAPVGTTAVAASKLARGSDLHWLSVEQLRNTIARKEVTAVEVTEHFIQRAEIIF